MNHLTGCSLQHTGCACVCCATQLCGRALVAVGSRSHMAAHAPHNRHTTATHAPHMRHTGASCFVSVRTHVANYTHVANCTHVTFTTLLRPPYIHIRYIPIAAPVVQLTCRHPLCAGHPHCQSPDEEDGLDTASALLPDYRSPLVLGSGILLQRYAFGLSYTLSDLLTESCTQSRATDVLYLDSSE